MDHPTRSIRRRRIVVDKKLQWSLCGHTIVHGVWLLVLVAVGLFSPLLLALRDGAPNEAYDSDVATVMLYMHHRFWWVAAFGCVAIALGALRFSHRIAGPMVRFKRNLRWLGEGQLPAPLVTRGGDFFKEEVRCLNFAVEGVQQRLATIRAAHADLRRELGAAIDAVRASGAEVDLSPLAAAEANLAAGLAQFQPLADVDRLAVGAAGAPQLAMVGEPT
jgi:hypothetical protein